MPSPTAILLPGTGSDEHFVREVFAGPLADAGLNLLAPAPPVGIELGHGYLAELEHLAEQHSPVLVGGVSFGAHLATEWALRSHQQCAGLLLALPAWTGEAATAPAAIAANASADLVEREGLDRALAISVTDVPHWLARELDRSWRRHGDQLPGNLRSAARRRAPDISDVGELDVPVGIAACGDDPVHPASIAHALATALPNAALLETSLETVGADRTALGRAAVSAWLSACASSTVTTPPR